MHESRVKLRRSFIDGGILGYWRKRIVER